MMNEKQVKAMHWVIRHIKDGAGWVGESMMRIYAQDEDLGSWADVEEYLDRYYDHFKVCGEKVWDLVDLGKTKIRKEYKNG